jgi:flagellin
MSLRIQNNVAALGAYNNLARVSMAVESSMQKLSTGYRINSAADDAAGPVVSERMRAQIGGLNAAQKNISTGINLIQTQEAMLGEVHGMLQRVRELAVQYKNGATSGAERAAIQTEVNALASEIERVGATAQFNGISLLNTAGTITFQVGADDSQIVTAALISLGATLGVTYYSLTTAGASDISEIDAAINAVSAQRSVFGSTQNRLERTFNAQATYAENLSAAESRVRDTDMAAEIIKFTKNQILQSAANSMLAQASQSSASVLQLLNG